MKKNVFSIVFMTLLFCIFSCKKTDLASEDLSSALKPKGDKAVLETTPSTCDVFDFEGIAHEATISSVTSKNGIATATFFGDNTSPATNTNLAIGFNSQLTNLHPNSQDMGTPNGVAVPGGPGVGSGGESGTYINNVALGIMATIDNRDPNLGGVEADVPAYLSFDFGSQNITANYLTVIDVEFNENESGTVYLYDTKGGTLITQMSFPNTGANGVARINLGSTPNVSYIVVSFDGSLAIDNLEFCLQAPPTGQCTYTQGYWKNHGPNPSGNNSNEWPVTNLTLGNHNYTDVQLESILRRSVSGNGLVSLAHQLIAAKLNIANGASATAIQSTITQADALIATVSQKIPPIGNGYLSPASVSTLVNTLTQYNEGTLPGGPAHCD